MNPASSWYTARAISPQAKAPSTLCRSTCRTRLSSPAPTAWDTCTEKPTPTPARMPLMSQMDAAFTDTAAVPPAPRAPTMAVST